MTPATPHNSQTQFYPTSSQPLTSLSRCHSTQTTIKILLCKRLTERCRVPAAAVWALMLEKTHPRIATDVHYVAGDRVVSDPLCKPFSMGRNLFCVHSKKHMNDDPALRDEKTKTNRQTLVSLSRRLNKVRSSSTERQLLNAEDDREGGGTMGSGGSGSTG